ncbi:hypothetical protein [Alteromonas facilis]|uniref:hypothetical protein n=1 Tax=Alteromonas facilis TaxID=2048004 RepID=UPI000C285A41|nr:hypothetical protein [Alteromonas facilis]
MKLNLETLAAVTAIIVSVAALFVAWDQSQVMRAQQHASVWPIVDVDMTIDADESSLYIALEAVNLGVGPALLKSSSLSINGQAIETFEEFDNLALVPELQGTRRIFSSPLRGIMGAGQSKTILRISWEQTEENKAAFVKLASKYIGDDAADIDVGVCYCSVFDKCWSFNEDSNSEPTLVEHCPTMEQDPIEKLMRSINT